VIGIPGNVRVYLAVGWTDMMGWIPLADRGQDGLAFEVSEGIVMDLKVIGVDIAKRHFQLHRVSESGMVAIRRKISRAGFLKLLADLPPCLIGLGAGSGAHYWAREIARLGSRRSRWCKSEWSLRCPLVRRASGGSLVGSASINGGISSAIASICM
jgi:hypothetical protein